MAKRIMKGSVIKIKDNCVATVSIQTVKVHKKYKKQIKVTSKLHAKFDKKVNVGDWVSIIESRPLAKTVHWVVL